MEDCLFCKIVRKEIDGTIVFENENVIGFKDIYPQAKEHYLFISKKHTTNVNEMTEQTLEDITHIFLAIKEFTEAREFNQTGFRVVTNHGKDGGQTVFHTHFHVLAGEALKGFGA